MHFPPTQSLNFLVGIDDCIKIADLGNSKVLRFHEDIYSSAETQITAGNVAGNGSSERTLIDTHDNGLFAEPISAEEAERAKADAGVTAHWSAPEVLLSGRHTTASDVYALATVIWEIWTGEMPFAGAKQANVYERVLAGEHPPVPMQAPHKIQQVMEMAWHADPAQRLTANAMLRLISEELEEAQAEELGGEVFSDVVGGSADPAGLA